MLNNVIKKNCISYLNWLLVSCLILTAILTVAFFLNTRSFAEKLPTALSSSWEFNSIHIYMLIFMVLSVATILYLWFISVGLYKMLASKKNSSKNTIDTLNTEIERQKKTIENLSSLYNNLMEYDNLKTEFFSNISHELKTPLTVILGAIQLYEQKASPVPFERRKSIKHLHTIRQNCYRLLRLINNILDITRLDAGYIRMNPVNCNLVYLVEEITQSVIPYSEQKKLLLEFDTETEELITSVDIDKIERILLNLLSNAIKFTPPGGKILVKVLQRDDSAIISVKDSGFGIPQNMQHKIFERFRQTNSVLTREFEGSGIGLSLVKSFVELHRGTITLNSEENKGSEFIIEFPIVLCETTAGHDSVSRCSTQEKIIEALNIEFSDIYSTAS